MFARSSLTKAFRSTVRSTFRSTFGIATEVDIESAREIATRLVADVLDPQRQALLTTMAVMRRNSDLPSLRSAFFATVARHLGQQVAIARLAELDQRATRTHARERVLC